MRTEGFKGALLATLVIASLLMSVAPLILSSAQQEGFSEDFEGETWESLQQQGWKMAWNSPYYTPNVSVENGQLYIDTHVGGYGWSAYVWRDASWTDLSASLNWNTIGYWRHSSARVILRASGFPALGGAYSEVNDWVGIVFHMGLEYGSSWILYLSTEDNDGDGCHEFIELKTDTTQPTYYGSWHLVEATVSDNNVKIWVNGTLWADVTDERISLLPPGGIAIEIYEGDTLVDNIIVSIGWAPAPMRWPLIAGIVGVIVIISIAFTIYLRKIHLKKVRKRRRRKRRRYPRK